MQLDELLGFRFSWAGQSNVDSEVVKTLWEITKGGGTAEQRETVINENRILFAWYDLIGKENKLAPHHPLVAEAYWLGSVLLRRDYDYNNLHFPPEYTGVLEERRDTLRGKLPHHNLHVNVFGRLTEPEATAEKIANCRVIPVKIQSAGLEDAWTITYSGDDIFAQDPFQLISKEILHQQELPLAAVHNGVVCAILDKPSYNRLIQHGFTLQSAAK
ncbi:MAG: hypothetical protein V1743_03345 [Nanoarchaeota archaeon]